MEEFYYPSRGEGQIRACRWIPEGPIRAVVQIVHGLAESVERYAPFAEFLNERGLAVVGEDHMGHGKSVGDKGARGYFAGGWEAAVADTHTLFENTREEFPRTPYYLIGHSMGSFMVRTFLFRYPNSGIRGAVALGTAWQNRAMLEAGKALTETLVRIQGEKAVSEKIQSLLLDAYSKYFTPEGAAPLSGDPEDPLDGFPLTNGLARDMIDGLRMIQSSRNLDKMIKTLPVLFASGQDDPVGNMGEGVRQTMEAFEKAGMLNLTLRLYPGMGHEILFEEGRETVQKDILAWMLEQLY